ncbi:MAG: alanine racemase [Candidatus Cloacimonetes bacterium]|nr:alanine racemase [Candidatus Cloacimonadota bacterium]
MKSGSWIEISKSALKKNLRYLKKRLGNGVIFVSVIKGNAYGHGIEDYLPLAEENGINYFAVFDASEAERANNIRHPGSEIIIMGRIDKEELPWAIEQQIAFFIFDIDRLQAAIAIARAMNTKAKIHLEIETGLHRTGIEETELELVIGLIIDNREYLDIIGLCTHLAGAESIANYFRMQEQIANFVRIAQLLESRGIKPRYQHIACSAAALIYPQSILDMARIGIAQYGYWPSMETKMNNLLSNENKFTRDPLHRILSWKSRVMSIKEVAPGNYISYGNSYLTTKKTVIATVPVGYSHGYKRSLSNSGFVLIRGSKANVIGSVNMNVFLVNVTHIPGVQTGDEVVIIGTQGKNKISVAGFSELSNQMNYEVLSRLPASIPRIIIDNGLK